LYGRNSTPRPGDTTSATLVLADAWFCGTEQLCASEPVGVDAHEILGLVAGAANTLALSSRAFATDAVHAVSMVDPGHGTHLNGRRPLWLYVVGVAGAPLQAKQCGFLSAVLDDEIAQRLDVIGKVDPLPLAWRVRQRAALGLDDSTCANRPLADAPSDGIVRSPLSHEADVVARWVPDRE
jgi:hypothetical protein